MCASLRPYRDEENKLGAKTDGAREKRERERERKRKEKWPLGANR